MIGTEEVLLIISRVISCSLYNVLKDLTKYFRVWIYIGVLHIHCLFGTSGATLQHHLYTNILLETARIICKIKQSEHILYIIFKALSPKLQVWSESYSWRWLRTDESVNCSCPLLMFGFWSRVSVWPMCAPPGNITIISVSFLD